MALMMAIPKASFTLVLMFMLAGWKFALAVEVNERPIIGILSQESSDPLLKFGPSYIPASYVKFVEMAGARAAPILINQNESYYTNMFNSVNGVLWPGGGLDEDLLTSQYGQIGKRFFELAIKSNRRGDHFPIWATCQGFQLMASLAAGGIDIVTDLAAIQENKNLTFAKGFEQSQLFMDAPAAVIDALKTKAVTYNYHHFSVTPQNFTKYKELSSMFNVVSTTTNDFGRVFISTMEAKDLPFYAVQFHPEKPIFEWTPKTNIKHDPTSVMVTQYFANFFISQARKSSHRFKTEQEEADALIYNYNVTYTNGVYQLVQTYMFDQ